MKGANVEQGFYRSIIVYQQEYDKISQVGNKVAMAICGEVGDTEYFREMIKMDMKLYEMKELSF